MHYQILQLAGSSKRRIAIAITTLLAVLLIGLGVLGGGGCTNYPPLGTVTRIEVVGPTGQQYQTIDNQSQIKSVVEFVDNHRTGWGGLNGMFGTPVPDVIVNFYDQQDFKGHFGAGSGFFETQRGAGFKSRQAWGDDRQRFLEILGMSDFDRNKQH